MTEFFGEFGAITAYSCGLGGSIHLKPCTVIRIIATAPCDVSIGRPRDMVEQVYDRLLNRGADREIALDTNETIELAVGPEIRIITPKFKQDYGELKVLGY